MNDDDRAHWLEPSRPIAVDGEEPAERSAAKRPEVLPPERPPDVPLEPAAGEDRPLEVA